MSGHKGGYYMSIKVQKILMFIPIVNFLTVFFWLYAVRKNNIKTKKFIKQLFIMLAANMVLNVFRMLISDIGMNMNKTLYAVVFWSFVYLGLLLTSGLAIYYQEMILRKKNKKKVTTT